MDLDLIRRVVVLLRTHYEKTGVWLTPGEVLSQLLREEQ